MSGSDPASLRPAFATGEPLTVEDLRAAPVRRPRPSRWLRSSGFGGKKALKAAANLGIDTVGGLLEHLPVESGESARSGPSVPTSG